MKQYLRNNMAKFREFYVSPGAGSNFLAKHCLWCEIPQEWAPQDISTNEFFINRVKSDSEVMAYDIRNSDPTTAPAKYYDCPDKSILSESERIKPILIELTEYIYNFYKSKGAEDLNDGGDDGAFAKDDRKIVIDHCDHLWREDFSVWTHSFFHLFESEHFDNDIPGPVVEQIREVEDYFAMCREYYYSECERNDWDMFQICHSHPFLTTSPRLKFPNDFKTLVIRLDPETNMFVGALQDIKSDNYEPNAYVGNFGDNMRNSQCIQLADDTVSYRKIFFENNVEEIRKMYDFFDNADYFEENKTKIMKEFKEYHDNNMIVIKDYMPLFYERVKKF